MVSSISVSELLKLDHPHIIDLRSIEKYNDNHMQDALHVPFEKILLEPKKYMNYNDTYYLYCQKGTKSIQACMYLQKLGFKVVNIRGGYENWIIEN